MCGKYSGPAAISTTGTQRTPGEEPVTDTLENSIQENAAGPRRASGDAGSVEQHPLGDQIAADKYLAGKEAVSKNPAKAFTRVKIVPPGTV